MFNDPYVMTLVLHSAHSSEGLQHSKDRAANRIKVMYMSIFHLAFVVISGPKLQPVSGFGEAY